MISIYEYISEALFKKPVPQNEVNLEYKCTQVSPTNDPYSKYVCTALNDIIVDDKRFIGNKSIVYVRYMPNPYKAKIKAQVLILNPDVAYTLSISLTEDDDIELNGNNVRILPCTPTIMKYKSLKSIFDALTTNLPDKIDADCDMYKEHVVNIFKQLFIQRLQRLQHHT